MKVRVTSSGSEQHIAIASKIKETGTTSSIILLDAIIDDQFKDIPVHFQFDSETKDWFYRPTDSNLPETFNRTMYYDEFMEWLNKYVPHTTL